MSNAVIQKLKELGYTTIPEEFYSQVDLWKSWYVGKVKDFHRYREYNGHEWVKKSGLRSEWERKSAKIGQICS